MLSRCSMFLLVLILNTALSAQQQLNLSVQDRQLIAQTTAEYNQCLQQQAREQLDLYADVRQLAAHIVSQCQNTLDELARNPGNEENTEYYSGLIQHIKNRAIRKLLPLLMYEKSSRETATDSN